MVGLLVNAATLEELGPVCVTIIVGLGLHFNDFHVLLVVGGEHADQVPDTLAVNGLIFVLQKLPQR